MKKAVWKAGASLVFGLALLQPHLSASSLDLGQAANYVILQYNQSGSGQKQFSISGGSTVVNGPLASAANTNVNFSGNPPSGPLYQSSSNTGGNNYNGLTPVTNTATDSVLASAVATAQSQATYYGGLTFTQTDSNVVAGGETFARTGSVNVIDLVQGINMTNGSALTIEGSATDIFIFDVNSTFVSNNGGSVLLTGGVTPNHILWNYLGTSAVAFTGGSTTGNQWDGTVLAPYAQVQLHDRLFNGAFISGQNISVTSNPVINWKPFTPNPSVPEPATYATTLGALLCIVGLIGRRNKKRVTG
jgi:choice-of-anchor A domain-containing protein